ncbi:MAG: cysteine desulfurase family protein [Planctomycetota bacterium]
MVKRIYLDHNATTPLDLRVRGRMNAVLDLEVGNPSSLHSFGRRARRVLEDARAEAALALGVKDRELVFTASATEANNLALFGLAAAAPKSRRRILASPIEHPSILAPLESLAASGFVVEWLPVDRRGVVDVEKACELVDEDCAMLTMMWVNNELGTIQPVSQLCERCFQVGVPFHSDAVQALGKHPISLAREGLTSASFSAHKANGPMGVGLLFLRTEQRIQAQLIGGGQERERRAGTENLVSAVGMAAALSLAIEEQKTRQASLKELDEHLRRELSTRISHAVLNSADAARVPGSLSLRVPSLNGETALMRLDLAGFAVSLGSACSSGSAEASHVLRAIGLSLADNHASLRVSLGHGNNKTEVEAFVKALADIAN